MEKREVFRKFLKQIVDGKDLSFEESKECARMIMEGGIPPELVSAFLVALRMKGEKPEELAGFATEMIEKALKPKINIDVADTCGTGGDEMRTFNVSTASAIALSSLDIPIAKHGNRAVSSSVGSADILEKIGVRIEIKPEEVQKEIEEKRFAFLFAPLYHPAMKNVAPVRRELGIRTIFNFLGPLTNPARPKTQIIGVPSEEIAQKIKEAILILGSPENVMIVVGYANGNLKIDEISISGKTKVIIIEGKKVKYENEISPEDFGVKKVPIEKLRYSGNPEEEFISTLEGRGRDELVDFVSVNTGSALFLLKKAKDLKNGYEIAKNQILSGKVKEHLQKIKSSR